MKIWTRWALLVTIVCVLGPTTAIGQGDKTFLSIVSVTIEENDIAFAKNRAFATAQRNLLIQAIQELVEPEIYQEYLRQIQRLTPQRFLISAKIIRETIAADVFTLELEGRIQMDTLAEQLAQMNLVLRSDPFWPVTVLIDKTLLLDDEAIKDRLAIFHLRVDRLERANLMGLDEHEKNSPEFIQDLFEYYPQQRILLLIDAVSDPMAPDRIIEIRTRIFRQSDLATVSTFSLRPPEPIERYATKAAWQNAQITERLSAMLTTTSLKRETYHQGAHSSYMLEVSGLNTPFLRATFEETVLAAQADIQKFKLIRLAVDSCEYQVQTSARLPALVEALTGFQAGFELVAEAVEFNRAAFQVFPTLTADAKEANRLQAEPKHLEQIAEAIFEPESDLAAPKPTRELADEFIPQWIEVEPNGNRSEFNRFPSGSFLLGRISSRADEDIFQLMLGQDPTVGSKPVETDADGQPTGNQNTGATLYIDWIIIGRTTLSPQLKLYRDDFEFINTFTLIGRQNQLQVQYRFDEVVPEQVFVRLSDRIGFIQGETGGFKFFDYIIRYHWDFGPGDTDR
jgi:hypothetical protein